MQHFSELNIDPKILQAIAACGYTQPTEIQAKSIPIILQNKDVIGATETGSGKTAAFVIPALNKLATSKRQGSARILILTPTRELANQITTAIKKYSRFLKIGVANIIGGASYGEQARMLARPHDIVVATPGRLVDHLKNNRINLSSIDMFILDEADRMLDMNFIDEVKLIANYTPKQKQTLLFTATLDPKLIKSVGYLLQDPAIIDLSGPKKVPNQIKQQLYIANNPQQKIAFLQNLLTQSSIFKGIIFSATKIGADRIAHQLRTNGYNALALHGDLKQRVRKKSLDKLNEGKIQYLVATDVASRGIDIKNISHVINFDMPKTSDDYIHRVGRTGRAGNPGTAITIALYDERRYISLIEKRVGSRLQLIDYDLNPDNRPFVVDKEPLPKKRSFSNKKRPNRHRQPQRQHRD